MKPAKLFSNGAILLFLLSLVLSPLCAAAEDQAADTVRAFNAALLEAMKGADKLGYPGRYKLLDPVIRNSFALTFMGTQSLGRYGKTLSDEQRREFLKTYTEWTVATYAGRFDGYSGERFETSPGSGAGQGTNTVISKLIKSDGEEVVFYYLLRRIEGSWRVVDIQISGVSQLALTRAQFTGVIKGKGFDKLILLLKEKIKGFSQRKDK